MKIRLGAWFIIALAFLAGTAFANEQYIIFAIDGAAALFVGWKIQERLDDKYDIEKFIWSCEHCHFIIKANTQDFVDTVRTDHITRSHPWKATR